MSIHPLAKDICSSSKCLSNLNSYYWFLTIKGDFLYITPILRVCYSEGGGGAEDGFDAAQGVGARLPNHKSYILK